MENFHLHLLLLFVSFQILALQEDKKALERLTKSKESALLEAERILRSALERALIVEEVQNQNFELRRQIEICQARSNHSKLHYAAMEYEFRQSDEM